MGVSMAGPMLDQPENRFYNCAQGSGLDEIMLFWLQLWLPSRASTSRGDFPDRIGTSSIGSAAKAVAGKADYRANPSLERRCRIECVAGRISGQPSTIPVIDII